MDLTLEPFIDEMEDEGYHVLRARTPEEMWSSLQDNFQNIYGIIMDIMLPTGENIDANKSKMGILTGLVLLDQIRQNDGYSKIPLLIFTILSDQTVIDWSKKHNVCQLKKQETFPDKLVKALEDMKFKKDREN
jgi:CheY-like chemotaxis protein